MNTKVPQSWPCEENTLAGALHAPSLLHPLDAVFAIVLLLGTVAVQTLLVLVIALRPSVVDPIFLNAYCRLNKL